MQCVFKVLGLALDLRGAGGIISKKNIPGVLDEKYFRGFLISKRGGGPCPNAGGCAVAPRACVGKRRLLLLWANAGCRGMFRCNSVEVLCGEYL